MSALREQISARNQPAPAATKLKRILIGSHTEADEDVDWNPHPSHGAANPHALILGERGFGKKYATCCVPAELAHQAVPSIVFDYRRGFALNCAPRGSVDFARPTEINASLEGVAIYPFQLFSSDGRGPANAAQRMADTVRALRDPYFYFVRSVNATRKVFYAT